MLGFLKKIFGKRDEEEIEFPREWGLVTHTLESQQYGTFEDYTKEIRHYNGNEFVSRPYTKAFLRAMKELGIPVHDITTQQLRIPTIRKINPEVVEHD